jgi:IS30 family transposase
MDFHLVIQWSPEQIAGKVPLSNESDYLHVYAYKYACCDLHKNLRSQKFPQKRDRCWPERRCQTPNRRPISERLSQIEDCEQVGHWEEDMVFGGAHKKAIVILVKRNSF